VTLGEPTSRERRRRRPGPADGLPTLSPQELRELVELAHDAILVRDSASRIVFWNRGAAELYGWPPQEAIGRVSHELLQTTFPQPLEEIERTVLEQGAWAGELVHRSAAGDELVVASRWALRTGHGESTIVMEINRDVTAARRVELALRASEQALAQLFDNASDLIQIADVDGTLRYANRAWLEALGYRAEEVDGLPAAAVVHPDELQLYQSFTERALRGQPGRLETVLRSRNGREIPVEGEIHVRFDDDTPVSVNGFFRDISERKETEAERERLFQAEREARRALARQNEKLRELDTLKDEFISLISHEFRTPLTSVAGFVELLRDDGAVVSSEHRGYLAVIDRNARRLLRLVNDLLLIAQIDAHRFELEVRDVDLREAVAEAVEGAQLAADAAGVALDVELPPRPLTAVVDEARVAQLLDNLISNALKFTPAGGRVTVACRPRRRTAELAVSDTGVGIDISDQARVFDRFYRTRQAREGAVAGSGIGLTIVRAIVERHSGTISLESAPHAGTTVVVRLPLSGAGRARAAAGGRLGRYTGTR